MIRRLHCAKATRIDRIPGIDGETIPVEPVLVPAGHWVFIDDELSRYGIYSSGDDGRPDEEIAYDEFIKKVTA